jgi:hypothetical protein
MKSIPSTPKGALFSARTRFTTTDIGDRPMTVSEVSFSLRAARGEGGRRPDEGRGVKFFAQRPDVASQREATHRSEPLTSALSPCGAKGDGDKARGESQLGAAWFYNSFLALVLVLSGCAHRTGGPVTSPKLEILNQQVLNNPNNAQAHLNRGYTLALLGDRAAARADLRRALELRRSGPALNSAGFAYFNLGDYHDALKVWKEAADISQRQARYDYYCLAMGFFAVGDLKQSLENYQLAVEREPKFGDSKSLAERTAEWTPLERHVIQQIYALWSKTWRP